MNQTDVLIVGAGPTGLVLALCLTRLGVRVRIVDKAAEPGQTSRAVGVQARTLEQYRQLGLARDVVAAGAPAKAINVWAKGERKVRVELGEIGKSLSPFPYLLVYPQDRHEKLLGEHLSKLGVRVERPLELVELAQSAAGCRAILRAADAGVEVCEARYVAGADGARSFVREALGVRYPGGTYSHLFYVADVEATGPTMDGEAHFAADDADNFLACLAYDPKRVRLIGTVRDRARTADAKLGWEDVEKGVIERMQLAIQHLNWFSTYRVHHRVASAFRVGSAFLLGDAAHIHSPVGGQGMNTGIGDAINLAWKLALVLRARAPAEILDSYEAERIPFAQRLVHTTDRVFEFMTADGPLARRVRVGVIPELLAALFRSSITRRFLFETVSQIRIEYRGSYLSEGSAGHVHGGDRLPWIEYAGRPDNFEVLESLDFQLHVYGEASAELARVCSKYALPLHVFAWNEASAAADLARDAAYLIRPDGYVALAAASAHAAAELTRYVETRRLRVGAA